MPGALFEFIKYFVLRHMLLHIALYMPSTKTFNYSVFIKAFVKIATNVL